MRLILTGAGGLLGGRLAALLASGHAVTAAVRRSPAPDGLPTVDLDLGDAASVVRALEAARPEAVVHAAALADADACERDPEAARRVNVLGTATIARWCRERSVRLIVLSTDLVHDGRRAPADEASVPHPVLVYGRTKLESEEAALSEAPGAAIARVALVLGRGHGARSTASEGIAWALRAGRPLRLFTDQHRTPVDPESVADALQRLLAREASGRFHLGGPERLSRHALGLRVARILGLDPAGIEAVTQQEVPLAGPRPADVSLDSTRARTELGWSPRPIDAAIREGRPAAG